MTEPTRSRWRGLSPDARTAERRALLLDVGLQLLGTEGMAGTTVRGVCEAARLNPRYFYESFPDLDALVVAVFDRTSAEGVAVMMRAAVETAADPVASQDTVAATRAGIEAYVRYISEDPRRARVLFMEGLSSEALGRRRFAAMHDLAETLARDAVSRITDDPTAPVDSIVRVGANLMVGGMAELMISWVHDRLDVTLDELVEDASELFVAMGEAVESIVETRRRAVRPPGRAG